MSEIQVDTVSEKTAASGVTVDGVVVKDSGLTIPSGGTLTVASGGTLANSGTVTGIGLFSSYAIIADQKTQNTAGGTFTLGAWRERDLQTELADPDGIVSIASNRFTLAAGTYLIRWVCPSNQVQNSQSRLYNVTDAAEVGVSNTNVTYVGGYASGSIVSGAARTTIAAEKTFSIEHQCDRTFATSGFGAAANFGTEQYTTVEIFKET
tara:strand:+ start:269 stop:892 length:624 start_codon:yes stop_codon:yes gene_type:complete